MREVQLADGKIVELWTPIEVGPTLEVPVGRVRVGMVAVSGAWSTGERERPSEVVSVLAIGRSLTSIRWEARGRTSDGATARNGDRVRVTAASWYALS